MLRHSQEGSARRAAKVSAVPIINAGDGPGQHPTQALLDVYTIKRELGRLSDFKIGMVGDLAHGRTVRSLAYVLSMYPGVRMTFVAPPVVRMKDDIKEFLTSVVRRRPSASPACSLAFRLRTRSARPQRTPARGSAPRAPHVLPRPLTTTPLPSLKQTPTYETARKHTHTRRRTNGRAQGVQWEEATDLREVAASVDVLYQTRIQRERFVDPAAYEQARGARGARGPPWAYA